MFGFDFYSMANSYNERKVDNYCDGGLTIDTCSVTDGEHEYETGICHPLYNNGNWIIVEAYDTKNEAEIGHFKWVKIMTSGELPDFLKDCKNSEISRFIDDDIVYYKSKE